MNIAIVGCGFVSDYYLQTLKTHSRLRLIGAYDRDPERLARFTAQAGVRPYASLLQLCQDHQVDLVVNLTNPTSHYEVSRCCLEHGKHVYSEKPLATRHEDAVELVELASQQGCMLSAAPCSLLGSTAQSVLNVIRSQELGQIYSVYAEMDDGLVHRMPYHKWFNSAGTPWPYKEEFESGCTWEHAAYYVSWLVAFFGPVQGVHAYASTLVTDKRTDVPLQRVAPDFSVACLEFGNGVVARLTCSIIAPRNHGLSIHGENGVLSTRDCWHYRSPVYFRRWITLRKKLMLHPWAKRIRLDGSRLRFRLRGAQQMDFCRGIDDMAVAAERCVGHTLSAEFSLHVNEVVLAIQEAGTRGERYEVRSSISHLFPHGMPEVDRARLGTPV